MKTFIICGYGIPPNKQETENYTTYLNVAFNQMFDRAQWEPALIIPSGGPTNCTAPYEGTEAELIAGWIEERKDRAEDATKKWEIIPEVEALSTPENLIYAKQILDDRNKSFEVVVFCEFVRKNRVEVYAREVFGADVEVIAIDFDSSINRYHNKKKVEELMRKQIEDDLPIFKSVELQAEHHAFYVKKLEMLRKWQEEGMPHEDAIKKWWDEYVDKS